MTTVDATDLAILRALLEEPRAGVREYARRLGLARATVQNRIDRLERSGAIASYAPQLSLAALGYPILALLRAHLRQGALDTVSEQLALIPNVLEIHSTTGDADLTCRVAARDNGDLEEVIQRIIALDGVVRTHSDIALRERLAPRQLPLVSLVEPARRGRHPRATDSSHG